MSRIYNLKNPVVIDGQKIDQLVFRKLKVRELHANTKKAAGDNMLFMMLCIANSADVGLIVIEELDIDDLNGIANELNDFFM